MRMRAKSFVAALLTLALPSQQAVAACAVTVVNLAIGGLVPGASPSRDTVGNIAVTCSGSPGEVVRYRIALNPGSSGTFAMRQMKVSSGGTLDYNLYADAARNVVWGDGTGGTAVVTDSYPLGAPSVTRNYPVFARALGKRDATVGRYADSVLVTLVY